MDYRLSPKAELDLDNIWLYVARESGSIEIASRLVELITYQFFLLARNPYLGCARDDEFGAGKRSIPVKGYLIVYRVETARC